MLSELKCVSLSTIILLISSTSLLSEEQTIAPTLIEKLQALEDAKADQASKLINELLNLLPDNDARLEAMKSCILAAPSPQVHAALKTHLKWVIADDRPLGFLGINHIPDYVNIEGKLTPCMRVGGAKDGSVLKVGDLIMKINGKHLLDEFSEYKRSKLDRISYHFAYLIKIVKPGDEVQLEILRNYKPMVLNARLGQYNYDDLKEKTKNVVRTYMSAWWYRENITHPDLYKKKDAQAVIPEAE